jgi:hypothetical protein
MSRCCAYDRAFGCELPGDGFFVFFKKAMGDRRFISCLLIQS